ncbi:MAG: AraC family transcriptional regulator [Clostridia bacterium]|nr:AraC family transcriptional regulator [Clostridia bacterium]
MNELFEYINPLASPYEAFFMNTETDLFPIQKHWHYYIEILYFLKGSATIETNDETFVATPNSLVLFPGKSLHAIYHSENNHAEYIVIKFDTNVLNTSESYLPRMKYILEGIHSSSDCRCFFPEEIIQKYHIKGLLMEIVNEFTGKKYGYDFLINADLQKLFTYLIRIWISEGYTIPKRQVPKYELSFDEITEYINYHYYEDLKAEKLAEMCHMAHSTFSSNFRKRYGRSCKEYINYIRINVAENMLLFTDYDINFISQEVGYSDCSYFIRCYKKLKGITPNSTRKKYGSSC